MTIARYLFVEYSKVLLFCLLTLVGILFTTRLELLASYACMGAAGSILLRFAYYQMAYILPIVIPISCLVSATLLFQKLSKQSEMTALRAGGLSLGNILAPILIPAMLLSLFNFYLVSEVATQSHLATKMLDHELHAINPLSLLRSTNQFLIRNFYFEVKGSSPTDMKAEHVFFAHYDRNIEATQLMVANTLTNDGESLKAEKVALFRPLLPSGIAVEQTREAELTSGDLSVFLKRRSWKCSGL